jgi:protein SCO1/2
MTTLTGYKRQDTFFEKVIASKIFWIVFILYSAGWPIYRTLNRTLPDPLPKIAVVPNFTFTNQFGKPFGSQNLSGKLYLANFIFTSCPSTCPLSMQRMQKLQKRMRGLGDKVGILSFTVDPKTDTPEVLNQYANKNRTNPFIWNLVTAPEAEMKKLLMEGFKVPMGEREVIANLIDVAHTEKIVLVDAQGTIRGFYGPEEKDSNQLMIDVGLLANNAFRR